MATLNKVQLIGRVGSLEMRYTSEGKPILKLRLATHEGEKTSWHNINVWGTFAEHCNKYLKVGDQAYVEGSLNYRSWEDNGITKYITEINTQSIQFLGNKEKSQ